MKERPILFSAAMVRAILDRTKTQTRRVVKWRHITPGLNLSFSGLRAVKDPGGWVLESDTRTSSESRCGPTPCPYGQPGDRLRVKEAAWMWCERRPNGTTKTGRAKWLYVPMRAAGIFYAAEHPSKPSIGVTSPDTGNEWGWRLKIGRFLPAWASRITLEVTNVRVERLQAISADDAVEEGIERDRHPDDRFCLWRNYSTGGTTVMQTYSYQTLWEQINGPDSWAANPWVWVVEFSKLKGQQ